MAREEFFKNINSVISDWKNTGFTFNSKTSVPGLDDTNLTYGNGEEKKGIEIKEFRGRFSDPFIFMLVFSPRHSRCKHRSALLA